MTDFSTLTEQLGEYLVEREDWSVPGKYRNMIGEWRCCPPAQLIEDVRNALTTLTAAPLPDEVADIRDGLTFLAGCHPNLNADAQALIRDTASLLERMGRENERFRKTISPEGILALEVYDENVHLHARIAELEAENKRLTGLVDDMKEGKFWEDDEEKAGQAARIRQLEAERDLLKAQLHAFRDGSEFLPAEFVIAAEAERDAIREQTVADVIAQVNALDFDAGILMAIVDCIRALSQPAEDGKEGWGNESTQGS